MANVTELKALKLTPFDTGVMEWFTGSSDSSALNEIPDSTDSPESTECKDSPDSTIGPLDGIVDFSIELQAKNRHFLHLFGNSSHTAE